VLICGAAAIATTGAAAASTGPPQIMTTYFGATIYPCSNGTCAIGPGDTGMPFTAALVGTGGPPYAGPESNPYEMSVVSGSLPPGLKLALPDVQWVITGTPTRAGTYTFTVQIAAQAGGPDGYQTFTITIGNGTPASDHLVISSAQYLEKNGYLRGFGFDVNVGATYTVYNTSTGAEIGPLREDSEGNPGAPFPGDGGMNLTTHISAPADLATGHDQGQPGKLGHGAGRPCGALRAKRHFRVYAPPAPGGCRDAPRSRSWSTRRRDPGHRDLPPLRDRHFAPDDGRPAERAELKTRGVNANGVDVFGGQFVL
jgi:Putative Ig domain